MTFHDPKPRLLTVSQVTELLGISRSMLNKLVASEALPPVRIGRAVRFDLRDIDEFLRKHKDGGAM